LLVVRSLAIGAIVPLLLCATPTREQQNQETATVSGPQLIRVDAVLTGKDGKPIEDAWPQSFSVQEDGMYQALVSVEHFTVVNTDTWAESDESPILVALDTTVDREKLLPIARNHRMIVLFFDLTSLAGGDLERSVDAARKFVKQQMTPADLVAVVSFGTQFKVNSGFTNARETLDRTLALLVPDKDKVLQSVVGSPTDVGADDQMTDFIPDEDEFSIFNADSKLYAVEALAKFIGVIPGRKSVIEFTRGTPPIGDESKSTLRAAISEANKNTVSLYEVDLRETAAAGQSADADQNNAGDQNAADAEQLATPEDSRKVLASLAQETGGKLYSEVKDFSAIFGDVQQNSQDYYVLAYYSSNYSQDGAFHKISVLFEGKEDAQIQSRSGYYAPGN
jgi:VWFA-related protein